MSKCLPLRPEHTVTHTDMHYLIGFIGTIITIAHRINTIIDSDKIVVLKEGLVVEQGTPAALLDNPDSAFSAMTHELGPAAAAKVNVFILLNVCICMVIC